MRALSTAPVADSCVVEVCKSCVNSADRATRQATPAAATVACTPRMLRLRLPMRRCRCETTNGWQSFVGAMAASCCFLSSAIQESLVRGMACVTLRRGGGGDSSDPRGKASTGSHNPCGKANNWRLLQEARRETLLQDQPPLYPAGIEMSLSSSPPKYSRRSLFPSYPTVSTRIDMVG